MKFLNQKVANFFKWTLDLYFFYCFEMRFYWAKIGAFYSIGTEGFSSCFFKLNLLG